MALGALLGPVMVPAARGDVIHFVNGDDPVEGRIVSENSSTVVIETDRGRVAFSRGEVERVERKPWRDPREKATPAPGTDAGTAIPGSATLATPTAAPGTGTGPGNSGAGEPTAGATSRPAPSKDPRVAEILAAARKAAAAARERKEPAGPAVAGFRGALGDLGVEAIPALGTALAAETDPDLAEILEGALSLHGRALVAGEPIVATVEARRLDTLPPVLRACGAFGGERGARALWTLLDEGRKARAALMSPDAKTAAKDAELRHLVQAAMALDPHIIEGLARSTTPEAARRLLQELTTRSDGSAGLGDALARALRGAMAGAQDRAAARAVLDQALETLSGEPLADLVRGIGGGGEPETLAGLVAMARRAARQPLQEPARDTVLVAAVDALTSYVRPDDEGPPPPDAEQALLDLARDPSEQVREAAVAALGMVRVKSPAVLTLFVDAYEADPSGSVRLQAHAALVRAAGENLGTVEAWRRWAQSASPGR